MGGAEGEVAACIGTPKASLMTAVRRTMLLVAGFPALGLLIWDWYGARLRLSAEEILSVRPGMTMDEVRSVLGRPLKEEVRGSYDFYSRCNPERVCHATGRSTWTYTRKPATRAFVPFLRFPMLWVHFNSRGHVDEVYAKEYFQSGMDCRGVYMSRLDPCDASDRTLDRTYIDEGSNERLEELF